jgi:hypothetical protein
MEALSQQPYWLSLVKPQPVKGRRLAGYFARLRIMIKPFRSRQLRATRMTKPLIFTISAAWDNEAAVWTGHCDDIPAAADAPTLDELLAKISAMALDLLPDNHPGVDPASVYLQITALREAESVAA